MNSNPNPQGKGQVPVLASIEQCRALEVPAKHVEQISNELFTSLFILHSSFSFKPVLGKRYWLYRKENQFRLSLIAPEEWNSQQFGRYIGECELHKDITWTLKLSTDASQDVQFLAYIEKIRKNFDESLKTADSIKSILPVYEKSLPFYQRVYASALANSLTTSMEKSNISTMSYSEAKRLEKS